MTVVDLHGCLAAGSDGFDIARLQEAICDVLNVGCLDVVVNLCGLTRIDASGLGALAMMMKTVRGVGGRATLVGASAPVARMLAIAGLNATLKWEEAEAPA